MLKTELNFFGIFIHFSAICSWCWLLNNTGSESWRFNGCWAILCVFFCIAICLPTSQISFWLFKHLISKWTITTILQNAPFKANRRAF